MKLISKYLLGFAATVGVLTILFRYFLSRGIDVGSLTTIVASSVLYGIAMFISGWYWGVRDGNYLPIFDIGFRFHLTTFIVHNLISYLWLAAGFASIKENYTTLFWVLGIWGGVVMIHALIFAITRRKTIRNLNKADLFE